MPCLTGSYNAALGPILNIGVLPAGTATLGPGAPPQVPLFPTLIDTGASNTCISPQVAKGIGLRPMGLRQMASATQVAPVNVYLVDLAIPFGGAAYFQQGSQVLEFAPPQGSPFQVLLGRDIICLGILTLSFDGHYSFSL
jgi:hypothetical protein